MDTRQCGFSNVDGVLNGTYSHMNSTAVGLLDCIASNCGCKARCGGSFNKKTGLCMTAFMSSALVTCMKDVFFIKSSDDSWISFVPMVPRANLIPKPSALWLMDNRSGGRNLGSKGPLLDIIHKGLTWNSEGPLGSMSPLKYARNFKAAESKIQLFHNGSHALNFTQPFTISLWLKTDDFSESGVILDGIGKFNNWATTLYLYPSKNRDQITLSQKVEAKTIVNDTNKFDWRHITAIYLGETNRYAFYLNGTVWPIFNIKTVTEYSVPTVIPDYINLGYYAWTSSHTYKGSMACITFFEKALTQQEVQNLMENCP